LPVFPHRIYASWRMGHYFSYLPLDLQCLSEQLNELKVKRHMFWSICSIIITALIPRTFFGFAKGKILNQITKVNFISDVTFLHGLCTNESCFALLS
jgi:hypothetical protein